MGYIGQTPTAVPLDGDDLSDDIITLAKMASGTDGNVITFDASGNPAYVATGTDGQVLTSTGAGSAPAFEAIPASGVWNVIQKQTASGSSAIEFTSNINSTYDRYCLTIDRLACSGSAQVRMLVSDDGGSSYEADSADYGWAHQGFDVGGTGVTNNSGSALTSYSRFGDTFNNGSTTPASIVMWFTAPDEAGTYEHTFEYSGSYPADSDDDLTVIHGAILFAGTTAFNALKFAPDTGTFTVGTFTLYGIKNT
jgi:hypothetical protein